MLMLINLEKQISCYLERMTDIKIVRKINIKIFRNKDTRIFRKIDSELEIQILRYLIDRYEDIQVYMYINKIIIL